MKQFLVLAAVCVLAHGAAIGNQEEEGEVKRWKGPFADHRLGELVMETPDVMVARQQHNQAHAEFLAILPTLPPEIRYQAHPSNTPLAAQEAPKMVLIVPQAAHPALLRPETHFLAEDVPRNAFGETPEVAAAREAHLKAHQEIRERLAKVQA